MEEYFNLIPKVEYKGPNSDDLFSYRYYNAEEEIHGKKMKDWLRFSVCMWHTFRGNGADPFGPAGTISREWDDGTDSLENALRRVRVAFAFFVKLGVQYYTFHDVDVSPEGKTIQETEDNLDKVTDLMLELQQSTGVKLLWGTANLFSHERYMCGGATNPNAEIFARAAAQVKKAIDVTHKLGGDGFVFWGGREGYQTLLNTDLKLELDHYALLLRMAVEYKKTISFAGQLLVEPKPREPMKHQYDYDVMTVVGFLHMHGLQDSGIKINVEPNHSQLAGHEFEHDVVLAAKLGVLGSVDANTGSESLGWDTDEFVKDARKATMLMRAIVEMGGLGQGGLNFDAKVRRESTAVEDMFISHIGSMDCFARGLRNAVNIISQNKLSKMVQDRYSSYDASTAAHPDLAKAIETNTATLDSMHAFAVANQDSLVVKSGEQEKYDLVFERSLK